jgi:hypothetical protein
MLLAIACSGGTAPSPRPSAAGTPVLSPRAAVAIRPPSSDILAENEVGLVLAGGTDHVTVTQAAAEQPNQPLALTLYRSWGWTDEAVRAWGDSRQRADDALLLLTKSDGAQRAFGDFAAQFVKSPFAVIDCPAGLAVDQCREGKSGSLAVIVVRVDRYVFRMQGLNVDLEQLATLQAAKIAEP